MAEETKTSETMIPSTSSGSIATTRFSERFGAGLLGTGISNSSTNSSSVNRSQKKDFSYLDKIYLDYDEETELKVLQQMSEMGMESEVTIFDQETDSFFRDEDRRRPVSELEVRIPKTRIHMTKEEETVDKLTNFQRAKSEKFKIFSWHMGHRSSLKPLPAEMLAQIPPVIFWNKMEISSLFSEILNA